MPTIHLMCGLPGSGKTTLAKELEKELPALRLSPDEWMEPLFGTLYDEPKREVVEGLLCETAKRALELGMNVILENGFWSKSERDEMRGKAKLAGASCRIHYLPASRETLIQRLAERKPDDGFDFTEERLDRWIALFDPPDASELGEV